MPLPSSINDLSPVASSNSPPGSESPGLIDDYLRVYASYIAQLRDGIGPGNVGRLIGVQVFSASGTYTPTTGTKSVVVEGVGGGGAAGGTAATSGTQFALGGAGGAGSYGRGRYTTGFSGVTVTIGAGGTGVIGATGNSGGTSSFGALLSIPGGTGGSLGPAFTNTVNFMQPPAATFSTLPTGANISSAQGARGVWGFSLNGAQGTSDGGASVYGPGGAGVGINLPGNNATNPGSGGSGRCSGTSNPATAGGNGANGLIIVWEFS